MSTSLDDLVDRVASAATAVDLEHGNEWEVALVIDGLLAVDRHGEFVRDLVDRAVATQTSAGQFAYGSLGRFEGEWDPEWTEGTYPLGHE